MQITKDVRISEIVYYHPNTASIFTQFGLRCVGCAVSNLRTLEQVALAHGKDIDTLIIALNEKIGDMGE